MKRISKLFNYNADKCLRTNKKMAMTQFGNTAVIVSMGVMKNEEDLVQAGCRTVDGKFFRGIVTEAEKRRTEIWLSREGSRLGRCSRKREQPWVKCQG